MPAKTPAKHTSAPASVATTLPVAGTRACPAGNADRDGQVLAGRRPRIRG